MYYISSYIDDYKIGVTDTKDDVEEFVTNKDIVKLAEENKIRIYGTSIFNHHADCTVLKMNTSIDKSELVKRLNDWKKVHNPWTGIPVENYLASAKAGTVIEVNYTGVSDDGRRPYTGTTRITKKDYDIWYFEDTSNTFSGDTGDAKFAAWALEVACLYNKPTSINILRR